MLDGRVRDGSLGSIWSMSGTSVFLDALSLLEGRFSTDPAAREGAKDVEPITGYAAVKAAFGMERDDPAIAYNGSDWPVLHESLARAIDVLNAVASEQANRDTRFVVWSTRPERTFDDVKWAFEEADKRDPGLQVVEPAVLRPSSPRMTGPHKPRWIICNLLGTIAQGRDSQVADVIRGLLPTSGRKDRDIIAMLDGIIDAEGLGREAATEVTAHAALWREWGQIEMSVSTFDNFIDSFHDATFWERCTDDDLLSEHERRIAERGAAKGSAVAGGTAR